MRGDRNNLEELGISPTPQEGSVFEYLSKPTPPALHRRIAGMLFCLALACAAMAGVSIYASDNGLLQVFAFVWAYYPQEIALGIVFAIGAAVIMICSFKFGWPKQDAAIAVKKATASALTRCPRSGVAMSTRMDSVRLRCYCLPLNRGVVKCWHPHMSFIEQDFAGFKPAEFGGVDMIVQDGKLYVFMTQQAKARWLEKT